MILGNFTPDTIDWRHGGRMGTLKPGDVTEFEDACANHILNKFGPRGIIKLQFGDDEETGKKQSMKIYQEFWIRQITIFNRDNQTRQNENKPYVFPTPQLEAKAEELGIELIGPWKMSPPATDKRIAEMKEENMELRGKVNTLTDQVMHMTDQMNQLLEALTKPKVTDGDAKKKK